MARSGRRSSVGSGDVVDNNSKCTCKSIKEISYAESKQQSTPTASQGTTNLLSSASQNPTSPQSLTNNTSSTAKVPIRTSTSCNDSAIDIIPSPSPHENTATLILRPAQSLLTTTPSHEPSQSNPEHQKMSSILQRLIEDEGGGPARKAYFDCPLEPPVTPDSLAELETGRIFTNPKLRHDVNFDRELHFRPNLDGSRGERKSQAIDQYWLAVKFELMLLEKYRAYLINTHSNTEADIKKELATCKKRLPMIFGSVKDILTSLVPEADQEKVAERLDVDFLMQQIDNGVCDLIDLATWLAKVIKTHCAPMRDAKVDLMKKTVEDAVAASSIDRLAEGLKQLVDIMECMKLDVANHQIRHIRSFLINDTVRYQQDYNRQRVKAGKIKTAQSKKWLEQAIEQSADSWWPMDTLDCFCSALIRDMLELQDGDDFTPTLYLDNERLKILAMEMHNYIYREICHSILIELLPIQPGLAFLPAWTSLQTYLTAMVDSQGAFLRDNVADIAAQIAKIIMETSDSTEITADYLSCVAEGRLRADLCQDSPAFDRQQIILSHRVLPKLQTSVQQHIKMTALELQDALVPPPVPTLSSIAATTNNYTGFGAILEPVRPATPTDPDFNLVRRLTHVVVLHWQIWADLLYCKPDSTSRPSTAQDTDKNNISDIAAVEEKEMEGEEEVSRPSTPAIADDEQYAPEKDASIQRSAASESAIHRGAHPESGKKKKKITTEGKSDETHEGHNPVAPD